MSLTDHIRLQRAAELEGMDYEAFRQRVKRREIQLQGDPHDGRAKLFPVEKLSPAALAQHLAEIAAPAAPRPGETLSLFETALESAQNAVIPPAVTAQDPRLRDALAIVGYSRNGMKERFVGKQFGKIQVRRRGSWVEVAAGQVGRSKSWAYGVLNTFDEVMKDPSIPLTIEAKYREFIKRVKTKPRTGRAGHSFFDHPDRDWMPAWAIRAYCTPQKPPASAVWESLCEEINKRQRASPKHDYGGGPSLRQLRTVLHKVSAPTRIAGREGLVALDRKCGAIIDRKPPKFANQVWETDQQEFDVFLRGEGERIGRIWMVNFIDIATLKVLGYSFGPVLSSDLVMDAAVMAISRYGVPRVVHHDLGKEFTAKIFTGGGVQTISGERLYRDLMGLWDRLGVRLVKAIGRRPKAKPIERFHAHTTDRFFPNLPGWCGSRIERRSGNAKYEDRYERPAALAEQVKQHKAWLEGKAPATPLLDFHQGILRYVEWVEMVYNERPQHGRYLAGLSPNQAWNTRQPPEGLRRITATELALYTAHHRMVEVRHSQVSVQILGKRFDYEAPELFLAAGKQVEVIVARGPHKGHAMILDERGQQLCVARRKKLHSWMPESPEDEQDLRQQMRCNNAYLRAVKRGIEAQRLLSAAADPAELTEMHRELPEGESPIQQQFMAPTAPQPGYISSSDYLMARRAGRGAPLDPAAYVEDAPEPEKPAPSLHDIGPVTVEDV